MRLVRLGKDLARRRRAVKRLEYTTADGKADAPVGACDGTDDWPVAEFTEGYSVPDPDTIGPVEEKSNDEDTDEVPTFTDSLDSSEKNQNENVSDKQRDQ